MYCLVLTTSYCDLLSRFLNGEKMTAWYSFTNKISKKIPLRNKPKNPKFLGSCVHVQCLLFCEPAFWSRTYRSGSAVCFHSRTLGTQSTHEKVYKVNIPCCVSNLVFYAQSNITVISRDVNDFCDKRTSSVIILKSCSVLSIYQEEHRQEK